MKLVLKIGKLFAIIILTVSVILISASFLLKDKVGFIILRSLNKNLSTKLEIESYKLSFLKKFPKASLELKNVLVHSASDFNKVEFQGINTDTLLAARSVSVEFKLTDIIKGVYTIEKISAKDGNANFFTDKLGFVNYKISLKNNKSSSEETTIDLRKINLDEIEARYYSLMTHLDMKGKIKNGKLKSRISGNNIDFTAVSEIQLSHFQLFNFKLVKSVSARVDILLQSSKNGIMFKKGRLHIDTFDFGITGFVSSDNILDLSLTGNNLDIARIRSFLPDKYLKLVSDYNPTGTLIVTSKIKGLLTRKSNPHIEINWQLKNGRIICQKSDFEFRDLSFTGHFTNGPGNSTRSSSLSISSFKTSFGSSEYTGSAELKRFNDPVIDLSLKGRVFPHEIKEFFNLKEISTAEGSVDVDLKLIEARWTKKGFTLTDLVDLNPEALLNFNSLTIGLRNDKLLFEGVSGDLLIGNPVVAKNIHFNYKGQNIKINGEFKNMDGWLAGKPVRMTAKADVSFDRLFPQTFFSDHAASNSSNKKNKGINLPGDIALDINLKIDSLSYKTFFSSEIEGVLNYQPGMLTFKSLKMQALDGSIYGNGLLAQNSNRGIMAKGSFTVKEIDVHKAFAAFHDFGQSFLKSENIKGTLSGSLSLLFPLDSDLKFHINTLVAEGKYHLINGELLNFDPVKQLSTFVALSELENISFEQLDNDFFIRNNWLFIPQMEVKSSAADLWVNGKHSFDNDYEYHVKILLSEMLSRNRQKKRNNITEFGVIEDDGLGRTALLLKIIGKGDVAKVSYDMKAAGDVVKNSIKKEKQTLKTILNQEYGWYKNDSAANKIPAEKKTRFRITWDDEDDVK